MKWSWDLAAVFLAGVVAGTINSVAGGGTLLSFPTLLWIGRDPIMANVTNTVALWPGSLSAMVGFRRELGDSARWMVLLGAPSVIGGLIGAMLLLQTPSKTFAAIVPYLILFATVLFVFQEGINRWLGRPHTPHAGAVWWLGAAAFQLLVATYGGYFGAGMGILMLAALGVLGLSDIHQMNGLKNFFAVCINLIAAAYFMVWGNVNWGDAVVMAIGSIAGGFGGAGIARRLGRGFVRRVVIAVGFTMAASLYFRR
jgi:hypothetical protein